MIHFERARLPRSNVVAAVLGHWPLLKSDLSAQRRRDESAITEDDGLASSKSHALQAR